MDDFNHDMPSTDQCALVILDDATGYFGFYPQRSKSKQDTLPSFRHFQGPGGEVKLLFCDNAGELVESAHELGWMIDTSTPGEPRSNGVAENAVGRIKEGIRTNLRAPGLHGSWWPWAGRHNAFARNMSHEDGTDPYLERHAERRSAPRIPFGALVWYLPTSRSPYTTRPSMDEPVARKGLFLGYHTHPGGRWNGDFQVADLDQFLDEPSFEYKTAKMHRTSRVDFDNEHHFPHPGGDRHQRAASRTMQEFARSR